MGAQREAEAELSENGDGGDGQRYQHEGHAAAREELEAPTWGQRKTLRGQAMGLHVVANGEQPTERSQQGGQQAEAEYCLEAEDVIAGKRGCEVCAGEKGQARKQRRQKKRPRGMQPPLAVGEHAHFAEEPFAGE